MNEFERLLALPDKEKKNRGLLHTPREIAQQPDMWLETANRLLRQREPVRDFLKSAGFCDALRPTSGTPVSAAAESTMGSRCRTREGGVLLSGAGSSEYIGRAAAPALEQALSASVRVAPSTDLVVRPLAHLRPELRFLIIHFARSGNSPESAASFRLAERLSPRSHQLCITCNPEGALAKLAESAAEKSGKARCFLLPEETNDRSLVMTSSFSSMALTAMLIPSLCRSDVSDERMRSLVSSLADAARRVLRQYADELHAAANRPFGRAVFLGDGPCLGVMQECCLKMLEMTEGKVAAGASSFLGLRHGPQVFIDGECLVAASLSSRSYTRQYEIDLLKELRSKKQGMVFIVICHKSDPTVRELADVCVELLPEGEIPDDAYRGIADLVAGQVLALFKCLQLGLEPDSPSSAGTIHRVVEGVRIYPFTENSSPPAGSLPDPE